MCPTPQRVQPSGSEGFPELMDGYAGQAQSDSVQGSLELTSFTTDPHSEARLTGFRARPEHSSVSLYSASTGRLYG